MKALLHLQKHLLFASLLSLCFSGCIKEPGPVIPTPAARPAWLLSRMTEVTAYGDPIMGQAYYYKQVAEFRYNRFYKPALQLTYSSPNQDDTVHLVLFTKDTFYYDGSRRVAEIKTLDRDNRAVVLKRFHYSGNDSLPNAYEIYYYDSTGTPGMRYSSQYSYLADTAVLVSTSASKGETSLYIYHQGNYTTYCAGGGATQCGTIYGEYTGPNVFLSLNLPHMIGLNVPSAYNAYADGPRISRENWQLLNDGNPNHYRSLTFNADGLLAATYWSNYIPELVSQTHFEYIQPE